MNEPRIMRPSGPMTSGLIDLCNYIFDLRTPGTFLEMVEVGCYAGESTEIFFMHLPLSRLHCVDPWDITDRYTRHEIELARRKFFAMRRTKALWDMMRVHEMRSTQVHLDHPVDIVYLDGDHRYEAVLNDLRHWMPQIRPGGFICGHDYGFAKRPGVQQAVDEVLGNPDAVFADTSFVKQL